MKTKLLKNSRMLPVLALAAMAVACILMAASGIRSEDDDSIATIHSVKGKVMVKGEDEDKWIDAEEKMLLYENDHIKTDLGASAVVRFEGGHMVKLGSLVTLSITKAVINDENSDIALNLDKGKIFSRVEKISNVRTDFSVRTPTAIAGVRGTEFGVNVSDDQTTTVSLLSGSVEVSGSNFESFILDSNQMTTVQPGPAAPQVVQMSPEVAQELQSDSKDLDAVEDEVRGNGVGNGAGGGKENNRGKGGDNNGNHGGNAGGRGEDGDSQVGYGNEDASDNLDTQEIIESTIVEETINNTVEQVILDNEQTMQDSQELNDYPMFPPDR